MGLHKGQTNNPNGRPKGSKSERTKQWEKFADWFMTEGMDRLQSEMAKLNGKEFVREVKDLMEYFQPKLARTEIEHSAEEGFKLEVKSKSDEEQTNNIKNIK